MVCIHNFLYTGKWKMRRFKLYTGYAESYEITKENYEREVRGRKDFTYIGVDGVRRSFAICPACDNPIQLIGLYKKLENTDRPYGRHYNRDTKIAKHNEQAYRFCPYASHSYHVTKESLKEGITEYEKSIYEGARTYFDLAAYVINQDTGIYISKKLATRILDGYLAGQGYMYYWATQYNLPWMLLYFMGEIPCYGVLVKKDCDLWKYFSTREDIMLQHSYIEGYDRVGKKNHFLNLNLVFLLHNRKVIDDRVEETIELNVTTTKRNKKLPKVEYKQTLPINEYRFPNFVCNARYRNTGLLTLAKERLPELS